MATITVTDLVTHSRLEPAAASALLLAAWWYLAAVRRLAGRGRRWPLRRTLPYLGGLAVIAIATQTGVGAYDTAYFTAHVVQHLLLGMLGPLLLALGAPITLGLQASRRDTRRRLLKILHGRVVRVLTHPVTAWALFGGSMWALYFTKLYQHTLHNTALHDLVHLNFVLTGCLFFWLVVGIDPSPHRLPYGGRILYVLLALPFHTILGVALVSQTRLIAAGITASDQQTGAGILWTAGEALGVIATIVVAAQWMTAEEREAARLDRQLDRQIDQQIDQQIDHQIDHQIDQSGQAPVPT